MHDDARAPHRLLGVAVALGLTALAVAALWAAYTGVGPADIDPGALHAAVVERSPMLTAVAIAITTIGSTAAMAMLAIAAGAWCLYHHRPADAVLAVGAMAGASLLFRGLKHWLDRPRPPPATRLVQVSNESLPSGHATMSLVVAGTIVALSWAGYSVVGRVAAMLAAGGWVGAVGATRVYLGVHWFSDVLAGWAVGAAWLTACVLAWAAWRRAHLPPVSSSV